MAPIKGTTRNNTTTNQPKTNAQTVAKGKGLTRRVANGSHDPNVENMQTRGKRKADNSPIKNDKIKRSALGNLTNNVKIMTLHPSEEDNKQQMPTKPTTQALPTKPTVHQLPTKPTAQQLPTKPTAPQRLILDIKNTDNLNVLTAAAAPVVVAAPPNKIMTRASTKMDDAVENCHRVLDKFEEALARPRPRKAPQGQRKPVLTEPMVVAIPKMIAPSAPAPAMIPARRISNDFNKTEESLYMSALEDVSSCESMRLSGNFEAARRRSAKLQQKTEQLQDPLILASADATKVAAVEPVPDDVEDFDRKNWDDPYQVSYYAMDIFNYLKMREPQFSIDDFMPRQVHLTTWMRTLLVDWMVEVQETFELNHETLYLAVKIVDLYLCRKLINKEKLQLLGAAAFFIACKYDERQPPLIDDFLYICDGAYNHDELVKMEMETLRTINFDLGIPLSYRFLRRYARCAKVQMPTLTLARYILELSLMDYAAIGFSDSKMAAAALFMAMRMHGGAANLDNQTWTSTLKYYTGYQLADLRDLVPVLNAGLHRRPRTTIKTIRNKYSHKIFHEVAKVPLLTNAEMFQSNLDLNNSISST